MEWKGGRLAGHWRGVEWRGSVGLVVQVFRVNSAGWQLITQHLWAAPPWSGQLPRPQVGPVMRCWAASWAAAATVGRVGVRLYEDAWEAWEAWEGTACEAATSRSCYTRRHEQPVSPLSTTAPSLGAPCIRRSSCPQSVFLEPMGTTPPPARVRLGPAQRNAAPAAPYVHSHGAKQYPSRRPSRRPCISLRAADLRQAVRAAPFAGSPLPRLCLPLC